MHLYKGVVLIYNLQMKKVKHISAVIIFSLLMSCISHATEVIEIAHKDGDMTTMVREAIENAKGKDSKLVFEKGIYTFLTDYAFGKYIHVTNHGNGFKKIIFNFESFNSVEVEGNGSEFTYSLCTKTHNHLTIKYKRLKIYLNI